MDPGPETTRAPRFPPAALGWAAGLAAAAVLAACGAGPASVPPPTTARALPPPLVLTAKDDHTLVSTVPGAVLRVSLASNPGTGYSWQVTTRTAPVLSQLGPPRLVLRKTRAVGVPGTAVFSFKAAAPGTTRLGLSYVGPGTAAAVGRTFSVTVTVR